MSKTAPTCVRVRTNEQMDIDQLVIRRRQDFTLAVTLGDGSVVEARMQPRGNLVAGKTLDLSAHIFINSLLISAFSLNKKEFDVSDADVLVGFLQSEDFQVNGDAIVVLHPKHQEMALINISTDTYPWSAVFESVRELARHKSAEKELATA